MNDQVKSAIRVLDLLELFAVTTDPMGVTEVARRMDIPKSSAQALLLTLAGRGYLLRDDAGYALPGEMRGGWVGGIRTRLLGITTPILATLAQKSRESAFVGVLTGNGQIQYLAKAVSPQEVRYDASLEHPRLIHATSMGLAIMAYSSERDVARWLQPARLTRITPHTETDPTRIQTQLAQIRNDGYAEVKNANVEGASGVSAPIFGANGLPVAALNVGAPTWRYEQQREQLIDLVREEAARITQLLAAAIRNGGQ